jgi:hypothetical protein
MACNKAFIKMVCLSVGSEVIALSDLQAHVWNHCRSVCTHLLPQNGRLS